MTVDDIDWTTLHRLPYENVLSTKYKRPVHPKRKPFDERAWTDRQALKRADAAYNKQTMELVMAIGRQERRAITRYRMASMGIKLTEIKTMEEWFR